LISSSFQGLKKKLPSKPIDSKINGRRRKTLAMRILKTRKKTFLAKRKKKLSEFKLIKMGLKSLRRMTKMPTKKRKTQNRLFKFKKRENSNSMALAPPKSKCTSL